MTNNSKPLQQIALPPPACSAVHLEAVSFRFAGLFKMDYLITHKNSDLNIKVLNQKHVNIPATNLFTCKEHVMVNTIKKQTMFLSIHKVQTLQHSSFTPKAIYDTFR